MTFAHPLMLWGMLAALIPLLVHLFDRRRPRPHPFPPISFVLRSQKRTASRLKLKRLILYALRTFLFLGVPFALAKPELKSDAAHAALARGPAATSIVLDVSLSMRHRLGGQSTFERARGEARDALKELLPEEPANVMLCGPNPRPPGLPGFDRARLRAMVDEAQPTYGAADVTRCIELAAKSLEESPLPGKRLVVVSDLTANAFHLEVPPPAVQGPKGEPVRPEVVLRDAAMRDELPNRAVVELKVEPATQAGARAYVFTFTVRNFSSKPARDVEAVLRVGDRAVAKGFVDLPPNGAAQKSLTYRFESGGTYAGEVQLAPDDLPEDDRRAFVVSVPKEIRALVVNGAPQTVRYRDEAFFVDAALGAPGSPIQETMRDVDAGLREPFEDFDLVLLLNVPAPSKEDAARLASFVEAGGGLFVSMGDQVDPDAYNRALGPLLPRPLRLVKTAAARDEPGGEDRAARLGEIDSESPVFSPFVGKAKEGLAGARFYKYMLLEAEGGAGSRALAKYEDGAPAFAAAHRGKGRVLLFTSTVDRDWSDFAIRTSFLPLIQRLGAYLAGALEERDAVRALVGEVVALRPSAEAPASAVRAPSGAEVPVRRNEDGSLAAGPLSEPGAHAVLTASGQPVPALAFAVTLDPAESDLARVRPEALSTHFGEDVVRSAAPEGRRPSAPLWSWIFLAAAAAFLTEGVLLRK